MHDPVQLNAFALGTNDAAATAASTDALAASFEAVKSFLRRQWLFILLSLLVGTGIGFASLAIIPMKYLATATVLLDKERLHLFNKDSVIGETAIETHAAFEGQMELLKSDLIAKEVIRKLNLERDPEFALPAPSVLDWLGDWLGWSEAATRLSEAQRETYLLGVFAKQRSVKRIGAAFAVEISFESQSAALAAAVANAIAEAYISDAHSAGRIAAREAGAWIQARLTELREQMVRAEQAVVDFRDKNKVADAGDRPVVRQEIAEVSTELTQVRAKLSDVSARLERTRAAMREYATSTVIPAMVELLNSALTTKLVEQYLELSNREAEYAARYGSEHKATLRLRERKEEVKLGLFAEMQRLEQSFLSEKQVLETRVKGLENALKAAVSNSHDYERVQIRVRELDSAAQSYRALYDGLLRRHSEAILQQEQPITEARVISPALQPVSKVMKKPLILAAVLGLGAMGLGIALSLLRDLKDRTFRTGEDIERRLKSDFIGMIPNWRPSFRAHASRRTALVPADAQIEQHLLPGSNAYWAVVLSPTSSFAEAIGRVKYAITRQVALNGGRNIAFTSVLPNEGASTIAAGVVQSFAQSGRSVVLVDLDFRHPRLSRELAPHAKAGLQEVLFRDATLDDVILTEGSTGFAFLPGIVNHLKARPEGLLEADTLPAVLTELRERYDYVIVDLPPMFPMLDVAMTDRFIESYVVVVEWGSSKVDTVAHALARCPGVRSRMLGFVLNKVKFDRLRLYDHRAADYYDPKRYSNYLVKIPVESQARQLRQMITPEET